MKLGNLLKKELRELLTFQAVFTMIFTCVLLIIMGNLMSGTMEEVLHNSTVNIADLDRSSFTEEMIGKLPEYGVDPVSVELSSDNYYEEMQRLDIKNLVVLPKGFADTVQNSPDAVKIECISLVNGGGMAASVGGISAQSLTSSILSYVREYVETQRMGLSDKERELIGNPVITVEYSCANGKTVQTSPEMLTSALMGQSLIAPFAVFFLVMMAAQMIMTAISTEKIDKTLETLLSAPVSRITVLTAKMLSALIVALLNSITMMIGFGFYMQGMMGSAMEQAAGQMEDVSGIVNAAEAMSALGLSLSAGDILIFGLDLFLTIAIALAVSLILGAMAADVKSVQTLTLPIMMATMIPFFVTMFADMDSLSPLLRGIMYIIPFTHTYTALTNLMFGHNAAVIGGIVYQAVFFVVCMYLAVKMFTTDLLFTMNFSADSGRKALAGKGSFPKGAGK